MFGVFIKKRVFFIGTKTKSDKSIFWSEALLQLTLSVCTPLLFNSEAPLQLTLPVCTLLYEYMAIVNIIHMTHYFFWETSPPPPFPPLLFWTTLFALLK